MARPTTVGHCQRITTVLSRRIWRKDTIQRHTQSNSLPVVLMYLMLFHINNMNQIPTTEPIAMVINPDPISAVTAALLPATPEGKALVLAPIVWPFTIPIEIDATTTDAVSETTTVDTL